MSRFGLKSLALVASLLVVSVACRFSSPTPVAWSGTSTAKVLGLTQTAAAPSATATPPPIPTETPPVPETTPRTDAAIPADGPWLIFPNENNTMLYALDRDTGELATLNLPPLVELGDLAVGIAPDSSSLVLRAGNLDTLENLGLYRVQNPVDPPELVSPLLADFVIKSIGERNDPQASFALQAVLQPNALAWKPNSQSVVFPAAIEGVAANLRAYQPASGKVTRLSVRYQQNFSPLWNPSGQTLLFQEVDTLNNPSAWKPYLVTSLNLGNPGNLYYLYKPPANSQAEVFVGWINNAQAVSYTLTEEGNRFVRVLNAASGGSPRVIYSGFFDEIAVDPDDGVIALAVGVDAARQNGVSPGIYLSNSALNAFGLVSVGTFSHLSYSQTEGSFFASGEIGLVSFSTNGLEFSLAGEAQASASPDGAWLVTWGGQGARLRTPDGTLLQEITSSSVSALVWQRDGKGFYLLLEDGLYHYTFPLLQGVLVCEDVSRTDETWFAWLGK